MALNFPGPYEVRIFYTAAIGGVALEHTQRLNCNCSPAPTPGEPFDDIVVITRGPLGGGPGFTGLHTAVDAYVNVIRPLFPATGANIDRAELWRYEEDSFESSFISAYNIDLPGTGGGSPIAAGEVILTFRTIEGGIMKLAYEEGLVAQGNAFSMGAATGVVAAVRDYILSSSNWILARDSSYPFAGFRVNPGQNEAIFKKRFRNI